CPRLYRDRLRDPAAESARLAIAGAITIERPGKVNHATRDNGVERARWRRDRLTRAGSYLANRARRLERLGLFFDDHSRAAALCLPRAEDAKGRNWRKGEVRRKRSQCLFFEVPYSFTTSI